MFCNKIKPLTLVVMIAFALPFQPAVAQDDIAKRLIIQGYEWHDQGRDDLAAEVWQKLLSIDPKQPDALLGLGLADLSKGDKTAAQKRLELLSASHNQSQQALRLRYAITNGPKAEALALRNARSEASAGRYDQAIKHFETVFQGKTPSPDLALEYYQCLSGSKNGWERASAGLRDFYNQNPSNSNVALTFAQVLTYREPTRREGIAKLAELSNQQDVGTAARKSWKQGLLWLNASAADIPLYRNYLVNNPNDAQILARIDQLNHPTVDAAGLGFKALNSGDISDAEKRFQKILQTNPNDINALGGLGAIRLRQQRFSEAESLLRKADQANHKWGAPLKAARYWNKLQQADIASHAGNKEQSLALLKEAIAINPREPTGFVAMADLQHQTDPKSAEMSFKRALALAPTQLAALQGLANLYANQGRLDEADALLQQIPSSSDAQRQQERQVLQSTIDRGKALKLLNTGDTAGSKQLLESAVNANPADPWARLDLARLYLQTGNQDQAKETMDRIFDNGQSASALHATALYDQQIGDWDGVRANIAKIALVDRTNEMVQLDQVAFVQLQARKAHYLAQHGQPDQAKELLSQTEADLGSGVSQPEILAALAEGYADAGDSNRALVLAQELITNRPNDIDARLAYANILLRAHRYNDLNKYITELGTMRLSPEQQQRYQSLRMNLAINQIDAMREAGNLKGANAALAPLLAQFGNTVAVKSAHARLYTSQGQHRQALQIYQEILQHNPDDVPTLTAAANSAAAQSDFRTGKPYVDRALQLQPNSPEVLAAAGRLYRADGQKKKAEQYFQQALLAGQQSGSFHGASEQDVANELQQLENQGKNTLNVGLYQRHHSGDQGLNRLTDKEAIIQGSFNAGQGRMDVFLLPTRVGNEKIENVYKLFSKFGTGPVGAVGSAAAQNPNYAKGIAAIDPIARVLMTHGKTSATQDVLYQYAVTTGEFASVRAQSVSDDAARQTVMKRPFYQFFLSTDSFSTPVAKTATALLNSPSMLADVNASGIKLLQVLATNPSVASNTPASLLAMVSEMAGRKNVLRPINHESNGVGAVVAYSVNGFKADIGVTPTGFPEKNVVGGVSFHSDFAKVGRFGIDLYRRGVMDSVESFAGTVDARTGHTWGGVTNNGLRLSIGQDTNLLGSYFNISDGLFEGHRVKKNHQLQGNLGFYIHTYQTPRQLATVGLNIMAMKFDKNLSGFTYGQGGYYSPQRYIDFSIPLVWNGRSASDHLTWRFRLSAGVQRYTTKDSVYFPLDPALQQQAETAAALAAFVGIAPSYIPPILKGEKKTNPAYQLTSAIEWMLSPRVFLGGRVYFNNVRDYNESACNVYLRFVFDQKGTRIGQEPLVSSSPYYMVP